ncbi:MAG: KTSC domain-containing protein [Cytophagaceae bacterium]|nr:MAG: KTSC domain-containing protein [Cytophagaceae bacterium]
MVPVHSSFIASVGYNEEHGFLKVAMKDGSEYHYLNIPRPVFDAFLAAPSHGQFFNECIREIY